MNFFEHQERARRQSRWLVFLFLLAVLTIIVVIDLAVLIAFGVMDPERQQGVLSAEAIKANLPLLLGGALLTAAVIGLASLFKTVSLRSGGGQIARDLGGVLVEADANDPLRRRLYNVVEEISLASGIPVPEVYVLEHEAAINAFAAGFTPADAAVAVTRGALEKLDRNELQGVIAHEFSHVMNGDMRLNIRLMGALFGILVLSLIGRKILQGSRYAGRSRNKAGGILLVALAVTLVGYIGLFFGRWIKAAVSRQREYLADASAVQFTRDPDGIAGALKKIAVYAESSYLDVETEEVSHMLFGDGAPMGLFSTHPPLHDRIARIDRGFTPGDLAELAQSLQRKGKTRTGDQQPGGGQPAREAVSGFDGDGFLEQIGQPDFSRILAAAALAASIPVEISRAARSSQWATEVLFYCLLDQDRETTEQQLLIVARNMGGESESRVRALLGAAAAPAREQRLPLFEISVAELKRRPPDFVARVLATVKALIAVDGRVDVFEYLMAKVIAQHLWESANPQRARLSGNKPLAAVTRSALEVIGVLALHGHRDPAGVEQAYRAGSSALGAAAAAPLPEIGDWSETLDQALPVLDQLRPAGKQKLVAAMVATVMADRQLALGEIELLRVICALIHVPLPIAAAGQA